MRWRYIEDKKYGGYAIQKFHRFLWWTWWSSEYLAQDEQIAIEVTELKNKQ